MRLIHSKKKKRRRVGYDKQRIDNNKKCEEITLPTIISCHGVCMSGESTLTTRTLYRPARKETWISKEEIHS